MQPFPRVLGATKSIGFGLISDKTWGEVDLTMQITVEMNVHGGFVRDSLIRLVLEGPGWH